MAKKKSEAVEDISALLEFNSADFVDAVDSDSRLVAQEIGLDDLDTCISSGILAYDLILGGGRKSGRWYSETGPEHGGKTTLVKMALGQGMLHIPSQLTGIYIDQEGTLDPTWAGHIWGVQPSELYTVFGQRKAGGKQWQHPPRIRYYKPQFGEQALLFLINLLSRRPEKVKAEGQWWYIYTPMPADEVRKNGTGYTLAELRDKLTVNKRKLWDANLYSHTGLFYVPVPNNYGGPELIIGVDSWSAFTPKQIALQDNDALGSQARMFSRYLNTLKSLAASRGVTIVGTKQIRQKIGGYGDPEYNPGGENLKHVDDVRCRIGTLSNKVKSGKSNSNVQVEDTDEYRYFKIRNKKNKTFVPFKECDGRWWTSHEGSSGFGIDPVFDTMEYLRMTGQYEAQKRGFRAVLIDDTKAAKKLLDIVFNYQSFKDSILDHCIYNSEGSKVASFDLRNYCFKQIKKDDGLGLRLFLQGGAIQDEEDDEEE